jgi:hypothetical protein
MPLQYPSFGPVAEVFRRYSEVVENKLEDFLRTENIAMGEVVEACRRAQESSELAVTCVDYLVAAGPSTQSNLHLDQ